MPEETPRDDAFHLAGDRLGKFIILSELGRGSMGVVYEALQEDLKRKVALKILPANITLDARQVRRFHREAESVARLRHDNVIQIYEVGEIDQTHYFAMELVDGQPLSGAPGRDKDSVLHAARIAMQAARGLAHAHERGVIHRDIKPSNLLLDRTGRVVVTDFGLARLTDSASLTSTDAIVGTPKYMSPEQILPGTRPLDGRTDVYSLGATLFHVIAGRPPFEAPSVQAFIRSIMEDRAPSPRRFNRQIPHDLATIILRCLEKDPADRYAGASQLADDIERLLAGERIHAKPKGLLALSYEAVRRHRIIASFSAVALVGLVLILILGGQVDILRDLDEIRDQADLDVAVQRIEELAQRRPDDERVQRARRDIYHERAQGGLLDVGAKPDRIARDFEQ
ncbi:MAG: serine/threonine-protein kinase, partial [Planctomycetota bacterium]